MQRTIPDRFNKGIMPGTEDEQDIVTSGGRKPTKRELRKMMQDIKTTKAGGAGIPLTWMWKELSQMTIAEATAMVKAMQSGLTWGEIQLQGLGGEGEIPDHEYRSVYGSD